MKVGLARQTGEVGPGGMPIVRPPPAPLPSLAEVARLFPQLEIIECLGRGGMGAVYKARQPKLDRFVALKILLPRHGEGRADAAFAERFHREARALGRLNHPDIVAVYDFGEAGGFPFLLMEFVDGLTLRQLLERGRLAPEEALAIVPGICGALQFAHQQGIVHRDIKPENILLDKAGRVKIADFGIAKILATGAQASFLTGAKDVVGTPHYMAPEQIEQPAKVDHRADIYSLGVVFYEMLTGELPLGRFDPPSRKVQVDGRLDEVVLRALEKEPERRYQQASQVQTAVETITGTTPEAKPSGNSQPVERGSGRSLVSWNLAVSGLGSLIVCALLAFLFIFAYPARVTVTGRVTDDSSQPLGDITVRAIPLPFWVPWSDGAKEPKDKREFTAVTDKEGRYRLEGLSAEPYRMADTPRYPQQYDLIVAADNFAARCIRISTESGRLKGIDFVLEPEALLTGRALHTDGHPLTNRSIRLSALDQPEAGLGICRNVLPKPQDTDGNGSFRFEKVPPGKYQIEIAVYPERGFEPVQASTNGPLLIAAGDRLRSRDFFFEAPQSRGGIAGRAVDAGAGNPVEVFSTRISRVDSTGAGSPMHGCATVDGVRLPLIPSQAVSWKEGSFLIEDISPGIATLEISAEGYVRELISVAVVSGLTTNVTIPLKREGVLRGRATRNGRPCGHGYVNLRLVGEAPEAGIDTQTDALGFYEYRGQPAGDYLLRICVWLREDRFSAQLTDIARARVEAGQTTRLDMEFGRSAAIQGSFRAPDKSLRWFVVVEDASPQAGALAPADRVRATAWKIERTGHYSLEGLVPGTYTVTAKCLREDAVVVQESKGLSLKDGETAELHFTFTGDER